jgi:type I restriction enzyme S subunit
MPMGTTVIIARGATVGRMAQLGVEMTFNQTCYGLRPISELDQDYLYYSMLFSINSIKSLTYGTIFGTITTNSFEQWKIPFPPFPEQYAIATALSDADALLATIDAFIAKKRLIKQGAMQELLMGKRRLPGFNREWEKKKIGDVLSYEQPGKYIVRDTEYSENSGIPVLTAGKTFILGYTHEEEGIYRNLPVIIFDDFTTSSKYVDFPFKVKSSAIKLLKIKNEIADLRFMFEKMQTLNFVFSEHKRYFISEYQNIEIKVPSLKEQQAIAEILTDMDDEIAALEQKRAKTRLLKQGMMQELLTGRIRLVLT